MSENDTSIGGWFKVFRKLMGTRFWLSEQFTQPQAWIDLLSMAAHSPHTFVGKKFAIDLSPGDLIISIRDLGRRWKWGETKVRSLLKRLVKEERISVHPKRLFTLVKIINWKQYQEREKHTKQHTKQHTKVQADQVVNGKGNTPNNTPNNTPPKKHTEKHTEVQTNQMVNGKDDIPKKMPLLREDLKILRKEEEEEEEEEEKEKQEKEKEKSSSLSKKEIGQYRDEWNTTAERFALPKIRSKKLSPGRISHLNARHHEEAFLEFWGLRNEIIANSAWLRGEKGKGTEYADWKADFDFFIGPNKYAGQLEKYLSTNQKSKEGTISDVGIFQESGALELTACMHKILGDEFSDEEYSSWFENTKIHYDGHSCVKYLVATTLHGSWMERQYKELLEGLISEMVGRKINVEFVVLENEEK